MTIDLDALRARLHRSLERVAGRDGDVERTLRERAQQLAAREVKTRQPDIVAHVIVVRRARSILAFPILRVAEVREVVVTRLPQRGRHVCGLFQLRGHVHCLVDVQPFVGPAEELRHGERALAVLVEGSCGALGVRIDEVMGARAIDATEIDGTERERRLGFVSSVTRDCVEIVDVDALFAASELHA